MLVHFCLDSDRQSSVTPKSPNKAEGSNKGQSKPQKDTEAQIKQGKDNQKEEDKNRNKGGNDSEDDSDGQFAKFSIFILYLYYFGTSIYCLYSLDYNYS